MEKIRTISFGALTVELGYATPDRVNESIIIQQKIRELGVVPKKLGEIMIDKGYLTEAQVKDVFQRQGLEGGHTQITGYRFLGIIGKGAMGTVYKAIQISMEREVAIKVLSPHLAGNEQFVARFVKEARAVARLNHPNIIQGIDVGESNNINYFAMEYVDGMDLEEIVKQKKALTEKEATEIIVKVAQALEHAHKNNLVHRDIKPRNILISKDDNAVKLCDLGLARLVLEEDLTGGKRMRYGTPAYISPEQARGDHDIDIRSDIYSLGATYYYCVTGEMPFTGENSQEIIKKHLMALPAPPKQKNPALSNMINTIILKMMAKKREWRYQTPTELLVDLDKLLKGQHVSIKLITGPGGSAPKAQPVQGLLSPKAIQRVHARRLGRLGIKLRRIKR